MRIAFVGDSLTRGIPGCSYVAMLRERLADDTLINLGKGNDTVVSLNRRVARLPFGESFDVAFLWVGVNDVSDKAGWLPRLIHALRGQRRSRSADEFRTYYRSTLDLLCRHAGRVIAVSPTLKGEDMHSALNHRVEVLCGVIEALTRCFERVEYLDLRALFQVELADKPISDYVMRSMLRVALDGLTLWSREQIDRKAAQRGLHFTLDGVHLNGHGAEIVAQTFWEAIHR